MLPRLTFNVQDEDETSEATLMFNNKAREELRKYAPTAAERARKSLVPGVPSTSSVKKKLNFDDSFLFQPPTLPGTEMVLAEKEVEVETLNRALERSKSQQVKLEAENKDLVQSMATLRETNADLRRQIADLEMNESSNCNNSLLDSADFLDLQVVALKYVTWYEAMKKQRDTLMEILRENKKCTREVCEKMMDLQNVFPLDLNKDDLIALANGSIQEFDGLKDLDSPQEKEVHNVDEDKPEMDENFIPSTPRAQNSTNRTAELFSPITADNYSALNESSVLNSTLFNTSIDFEKDEKIARLENEKKDLNDRLKLANYRIQKTMLVEEQKRTAEEKNKILEHQLQKLMAEHSALRQASANNMFQFADSSTHDRSIVMTDRVKDQQMKMASMETKLDEVQSDCNKLYQQVADLTEQATQRERDLDHHRQSVEYWEGKANEFESERDEKTNRISSLQDNVQSLNKEVTELKQFIEKLKNENKTLQQQSSQSTSEERTDAGDTTQIFHMANNPLQQARDQLREEENRKRKASESDLLDGGAKRAKDEEVEQLRNRLAKCEKEKSRMESIQTDFAKKYRAIVTVLTGYQIKVKDITDGICCVNSIYEDTENQFVFKYYADSQRVDLLDVGTSETNSWEDDMRRYIGERQSVPAFLASVTLTLESRRVLDDELERTHTYSVLHRD